MNRLHGIIFRCVACDSNAKKLMVTNSMITLRPCVSGFIFKDPCCKFYSSNSSSAHNPARLDLTGSSGSQAAHAATLGAMSAAEHDTAALQGAAMSSQSQDGDTNKLGDAAGSQARSMSGAESHANSGNVSLHASMQSSVPDPYSHDSKSPNHLNMPAGGYMQQVKLHSSERMNPSEAVTDDKQQSVPPVSTTPVALSQRERLKKAVKEYGATVIVFHTALSLSTLGISYAAVSSGIDVIGLLEAVGVGQIILESKVATGASTFVIAYAAHKVFAPARIAITLTSTPFIVRYLRRIGFLKAPAPKP